jgi:hypothetical protein
MAWGCQVSSVWSPVINTPLLPAASLPEFSNVNSLCRNPTRTDGHYGYYSVGYGAGLLPPPHASAPCHSATPVFRGVVTSLRHQVRDFLVTAANPAFTHDLLDTFFYCNGPSARLQVLDDLVCTHLDSGPWGAETRSWMGLGALRTLATILGRPIVTVADPPILDEGTRMLTLLIHSPIPIANHFRFPGVRNHLGVVDAGYQLSPAHADAYLQAIYTHPHAITHPIGPPIFIVFAGGNHFEALLPVYALAQAPCPGPPRKRICPLPQRASPPAPAHAPPSLIASEPPPPSLSLALHPVSYPVALPASTSDRPAKRTAMQIRDAGETTRRVNHNRKASLRPLTTTMGKRADGRAVPRTCPSTPPRRVGNLRTAGAIPREGPMTPGSPQPDPAPRACFHHPLPLYRPPP